MTALPRLADIEMYQRLYKTRPLSLGLPRLLLTSVLLPLLLALGGIRILFFCLFNAVYLALPARAWRLLTRPEWLYRLILFLTVGIIFRTPGFHPSAGRRQRLVVMNHHGVQDIFLFHFIEQVGVSRLVVSYPPAFYAWARRWFPGRRREKRAICAGLSAGSLPDSRAGRPVRGFLLFCAWAVGYLRRGPSLAQNGVLCADDHHTLDGGHCSAIADSANRS
jgi:hypothetical protein